MRIRFAVIAALALACGSNSTPPPPPPGAPAAPTGLTATASGTAIHLAWTASANATGYQVLRSTTAGSGYAQVGAPTATTYDDSSLAAGTTYDYVVKATNAAGASANSSEASATTAPAAPTGLTATGGSASVSLSWTAAQGATGYAVLRSTTAGSGYTQIATPSAAAYSDTGLAGGTTYHYVVKAANAAGASGNSAEASALTAPAAPTGLTATGGTQSVALSWTASQGASGYAVLRGAAAGGPYTQIATPSAATYSDTGLADGTTYHYVVKASNATGASGNSSEASAITIPAASAALNATPGNQLVALNWVAATGASSYDILSSTTSGSGYTAAGTATGTTANVTGLTNGTRYYFVIRSRNASGVSGNSNEVAAIPSAVPDIPGNVVATAGDTQVSLTWSAAANATGYAVYRGPSPGQESGTAIATPTTTSYTDTSVTNLTTYYYYVKATNAQGSSPASAEVSATPHGTVAAPAGVTAFGGNASVTLSWNAVASATSYTVLRSITSGSGYSSIGTPTTTSFKDTTAANGTPYYYVITATDQFGATSAHSAEVSATPLRELCVATSSNFPGIYAVDAAASGEVDARRVFGNTPRMFPAQAAIDDTNGEIYSLNTAMDSISVYSATASGVPVLVRMIAGSNTGLTRPSAIAVDPVNDEIFVSNADSVTVYGRTDTGNVSPVRTLTTVAAPTSLALDLTNNELWVTDQYVAYVFPRTWSDPATADLRDTSTHFIQSISNPSVHSIAVDPVHDEVFVSNKLDNPNTVYEFDRVTLAQKRYVSMPANTYAEALGYDATDDQLLIVGRAAAVKAFARTDTGTGASPGTVTIVRTLTTSDQTKSSAATGVTTDATSMYVASGAGITTFPIAASGSAVPTRSINPDPGLLFQRAIMRSMAADPANGELWVGNASSTYTGAVVYPLDAAVQNTFDARAPLWNDLFNLRGLALNVASNEVYATDPIDNIIDVNSRTDNAPAAPLHTYTIAAKPQGVYFDAVNGEVVVAEQTPDQVEVYTRNADGTLTLARTITSSQFAKPSGVTEGNGDIIVTNATGNTLAIFPRTSNGAVTARQITQNLTGLGTIGDVLFDAGSLYVVNSGDATTRDQFVVAVYPESSSGTTSPSRTITVRATPAQAVGLAFCN